MAQFGSGSRVMLSILKKIPVIKIFLRNNFIFKKSVFKTIINYISTRRTFLVNWVSKWWIYVLILTPFASILSHIYMCGITVDPNPQSSWIRIQYGSRSTTLLKIVPDCLNSCRVCQALLFSFKKMCVECATTHKYFHKYLITQVLLKK